MIWLVPETFSEFRLLVESRSADTPRRAQLSASQSALKRPGAARDQFFASISGKCERFSAALQPLRLDRHELVRDREIAAP
jgi:hypothetical protein